MKTTSAKIQKVIMPIYTVLASWLLGAGGLFTRFMRWINGRKNETVQKLDNNTFLEAHSRLVQTGLRTKATVLDIDDNGKMANFNPIVHLTLRLDDGSRKEIRPETIVSLLHLPQIQQQINIAYLPDMPHVVAIV